jgi:mono/diheme cytochrome c family protein
MQTKIIVSAILLSLGSTLASPSWAKTLAEPPLPPEVQDIPSAPNQPAEEPASPAVPSRGQLLYEDHCTTCHESTIHVRENRRTHSLTELRERVEGWAAYLTLHWSRDEVDEVVHHLNSQFYKFPSP